MNKDAQDMALYAGVGGASLVGGHLATQVVSDKLAVGREMRELKRMAAEEVAKKEAATKGVMSRVLTRGR